MTPTVRYPAGPITPHGAYYLLEGAVPTVKLRSYDDTVVFALMGGESICDRTTPERVEIKDLKGLVPPWKQIDQKGATQDGKTFVTSLYDPAEIEMMVVARGRNPAKTRQVVRDLVGSIDAIQTSELSWITPEMGRWWTNIRWFGAPADPVGGIRTNRQPLSLRLRAYDAFWRSYDYVTQFRLSYEASSDTFGYTTTSELGSGWTVAYSGPGTGAVHADSTQVSNTLASNRTMVGRRVGYTSTTDNQVIELDLGTLPQWYFDAATYVDFWARMPTSGTAGNDGVRCRVGANSIILSSFNSGVETVLRQTSLTIPPRAGEVRWAFVAGTPADPRVYKLVRNGTPAFMYKETGITVQVGSGFRAAGFGLHTDSSTVTPPGIRRWSAGDNSVATQSGFVQMVNVGDQPMWPRFTCFGPGTFSFGNGPASPDMVSFGPLAANQAAQIRTDPRKQGVVDLASTPVTPQDQQQFSAGLQDLLSFAGAGLVPALEGVLQSIFGLWGGGSAPVPPQGNLYSLLKGRFSNPVPAKSPGNPAVPYQIPVKIEGGNADTLLIAAGTPLRRLPY